MTMPTPTPTPLVLHAKSISVSPSPFQFHHSLSLLKTNRTLILHPNPNPNPNPASRASKKMIAQSSVSNTVIKLIQSSPPTWQSALLSNTLIFIVGSPILISGLSVSGIASAFLLGTLTWRAFGPPAFLLVAIYFIIVSKNQFLHTLSLS